MDGGREIQLEKGKRERNWAGKAEMQSTSSQPAADAAHRHYIAPLPQLYSRMSIRLCRRPFACLLCKERDLRILVSGSQREAGS